MNATRRTNARGKWIAALVLAMGVAAALAEWKFRPRPPATGAATQPTNP